MKYAGQLNTWAWREHVKILKRKQMKEHHRIMRDRKNKEYLRMLIKKL